MRSPTLHQKGAAGHRQAQSGVKASTDGKRARSVIRTTSLAIKGFPDRTLSRAGLLSECPPFKPIVLILPHVLSSPARFLYVGMLIMTEELVICEIRIHEAAGDSDSQMMIFEVITPLLKLHNQLKY